MTRYLLALCATAAIFCATAAHPQGITTINGTPKSIVSGPQVPWLQVQQTTPTDNFDVLAVLPASSAVHNGPFKIRYEGSPYFCLEQDNILMLGLNPRRPDTTQPGVYLVIEGNYCGNWEMYVEATDINGNVWRPWMVVDSKTSPAPGKTFILQDEMISQEGNRPAPVTYRFRPINKNQESIINVSGTGTANGTTDNLVQVRGGSALADGAYVDNPHTQPVESLCVGQVSAMHSTMRINSNAVWISTHQGTRNPVHSTGEGTRMW